MSIWGQEEIGPSTATPPAEHGENDPGNIYRFGPNFVRFVTDRFAAIEQMLARHLDIQSRRPKEGWRFLLTGNTDASGNARITIFSTSPGQKYIVHRLYVHAVGYSWHAPFTAALGELTLDVDRIPWSGYSLASGTGQIPAYFTSGRLSAVEAQDGETISLNVVGTATLANVQLEVRVAGVLSNVHAGD